MRMSAEHKEKIMRTARRLNLPNDDVLFLYIGAVEYTVQLCEDILGEISSERQRLEQSTQRTQQVSSENAEKLINSLTQVGLSVVADMQKAEITKYYLDKSNRVVFALGGFASGGVSWC